MEPFRVAHSEADDWRVAVAEICQQLGKSKSGTGPGFVYATDVLVNDLPRIVAALEAETGITQWVGTVGVGISVNDREIYEQPALAVMLADYPESGFRIFSGIESGLEAFEDAHRAWCRDHNAVLAVVHGDPQNPSMPGLINGLSKSMGEGFLVGGLTSSAGEHLQVANAVTSGGLSGVIFSGDTAVATRLSQGCSPIGDRHVVTESERNVIIEINGRPALDVFREDIGEVLSRDLDRVAGYIFAGLPITGSDTGDYLVRNLVGIDPENSLLAIGDLIDPGDQIIFCRRNVQSAKADLTRMLGELRQSIGDARPRGGVYFSCLGRGRYLFGENSEELKQIRQELGDFPLVGFFANGEISHHRLYGYTGVLTLFL